MYEEISLKKAHAYLSELVGNQGSKMTTLVAQLNGHDRRALDHLALTVHSLHLAVGDDAFSDNFTEIGKALASFLKAAAQSGSMSQDRCIEGNKKYRELCECIATLVMKDGVTDEVFKGALMGSDDWAKNSVSNALGGQMEGGVRDGIVNRHGGDRQLGMADVAQRFARYAGHVTNLVYMVGTTLKQIGRTDQLLNSVTQKQPVPAPAPDDSRAPGGDPAASNGGPVPGAMPQQTAPMVVNNIDVNVDVRSNDAQPRSGTRSSAEDASTAQSPATSSAEASKASSNSASGDANVTRQRDPRNATSRSSDESRAERPMPRPAQDRGEGTEAPTGAWSRDENGKWRMARENPIARTTEGAMRIDPFSGVGANAAGAGIHGMATPGATALGVRAVRSNDAQPRSGTRSSAEDASTAQSPATSSAEASKASSNSASGDANVTRQRDPRNATSRSSDESRAERPMPRPAQDRGEGTEAPTGAWSRDENGKWRMARENPIARTTEGAMRIDPFSGVGANAAGAGIHGMATPGATALGVRAVRSNDAQPRSGTRSSAEDASTAQSPATSSAEASKASSSSASASVSRQGTPVQTGASMQVTDTFNRSVSPPRHIESSTKDAGPRSARTFPTITPADRVVTTEGPTRASGSVKR
ncbi:hypothetical protein [Burkholderia sp. MSMB1498]|uniref:hypothetical protein n=1 Tax=Burkholderia sp. MSMB1498 TaxID=1637842 RepID=UPI0012E359D2|nr:hypothetical protein [Burkholderia sp. MSMB1498]